MVQLASSVLPCLFDQGNDQGKKMFTTDIWCCTWCLSPEVENSSIHVYMFSKSPFHYLNLDDMKVEDLIGSYLMWAKKVASL